jgi:hypothetical protein
MLISAKIVRRKPHMMMVPHITMCMMCCASLGDTTRER